MKRPGLPDLSRLDPAEKDALIVSLWETVLALEGEDSTPIRAPSGGIDPQADRTGELRRRIDAAPRSTRAVSARPSRGHGVSRWLDYRPLQILVLLIGLGFLVDFAIGWYQRRAAEARQAAAQQLSSRAFGGLFVELVRVGYEPDGTKYRATLRMQNTRPDAALYVMLSQPRVFIQTGLTWQEVPAQAPAGTSWGVVRLDGASDYSVLFEADLDDWSELIPGYMHVQVQSDMLISQSSTPSDDIVERANRFYFYLKPRTADDAEIMRRSRFPGTPPVFIPMPPH
ncbi:conserved hypothetical protein [Ancylobacter novellus DSM 506]|uniref:DUF3426 domain-containing protein n=1 Tax=Ancylobacter novellus (strain ATCC 8093 / DSM 506 / JCM 20403 / CCM 1077 / IAM 12100 / NBRC 12443 / NCIMB 10456) TaxID=639283 RepID=D7A6V3_ANCN5|nr:hypothetical protein [Ancylobacter novellus]ADH88327.1 conserved hypothetical protein [Ancylobacter novellus DSM 506]